MQPPLALLKRDATRPKPIRDIDHQRASARQRRRPLVCRHCLSEISDASALFGMDSDNPIRVFPNPHGTLREIMTVRFATGLHLVGPPTTEFTWFAGYAWEVAYCESCARHLGWRFSAVEPAAELDTFYGLLCSEVIEA
jgi:cereblon